MPGYTPSSTYPYANFMLVCGSQASMVFVGDSYTWNTRIVVAFSGVAVILIALPFLAALPVGLNYWVCFIVLIPFGAFSGIAQGTIFTMAAQLPFKYMGAVMFGNGIIAISCNVLRGITLAAFPVDPNDPATEKNYFYGALTFMAVACLLTIICVFVQDCFMRNNKFYIYYLDWEAQQKASPSNLPLEEEI